MLRQLNVDAYIIRRCNCRANCNQRQNYEAAQRSTKFNIYLQYIYVYFKIGCAFVTYLDVTSSSKAVSTLELFQF